MKVLITGGSQGIGYAIAESCAKNGHDLFLVGREQRKLLQAAKKLEQAYGKPVQHRALDISKPAEVRDLVAATTKAKFSVDVLDRKSVV